MWFRYAADELSRDTQWGRGGVAHDDLYAHTPDEALDHAGMLFHGTSERAKGPLRGGGYDGVLWTADTPGIAQMYIPRAGGRTAFPAPWSEYDRQQSPRANEQMWQTLARALGRGYADDIRYDDYGNPNSWRINGGTVTKGELEDYLQQHYGYQKDGSIYKVVTKRSRRDGTPYRDPLDDDYDDALDSDFDHEHKEREHIMPASYRIKGNLHVGVPREPLRIYDYAKGRESDLTDLDYHKLGLFDKVKNEGYDGLRITDFAQTENWGNLGHTSVGLLPRGIEKVDFRPVPATNWELTREDWDNKPGREAWLTPEYLRWHRSLLDAAEAGGKNVPERVRAWYRERGL